MNATMTIVAPVFGLILLGYLMTRFGGFQAAGVTGLVEFVFHLATPALLFRTTARLGIPPGAEIGIVLAYYGGVLVAALAAAAHARMVRREGIESVAVFGMAGAFSNTVILGIPLVVSVYGERGLLPLMLIITFNSLSLIPPPTLIIEASRGKRHGGAVIRKTAAAIFRNPIIMAMPAGLAFNMTGLALPGPVDTAVQMLGQAAVPSALFALGASLVGFGIGGLGSAPAEMSAFKLILHPVAVWCLAGPVLGLDPLSVQVATLTAALPIGTNVFILASRYGVDQGRVGAAIVLSTALAVVTLPATIALLGAGQ